MRQGRQLLDLDVADDMKLMEYMFACIRAGQIDEVTPHTWLRYLASDIIAVPSGQLTATSSEECSL